MNEISGKIENVHSSIFQSGKQPDPNTLVDEYFLYCGENRRGPGRQAETVDNLSYRVGRIYGAEDSHSTAAFRTF
jgi:hypothetical protein